MRLVWAPQALRDLREIVDYLENRSPAAAKHVVTGIRLTVDNLAKAPRIGPTIDEAGHRRLIVPRYPYLVYYRLSGDEVLILHVRHASRRPWS